MGRRQADQARGLLLCNLTGVQGWVGVLKVVAPPYRDTAPIWKSEAFPCRLTVEPLITLTPEAGVSMSDVMRDFEAPAKWGELVRGSPNRLSAGDGRVIVKVVEVAKTNPIQRPVDPRMARVPKTYGFAAEFGEARSQRCSAGSPSAGSARRRRGRAACPFSRGDDMAPPDQDVIHAHMTDGWTDSTTPGVPELGKKRRTAVEPTPPARGVQRRPCSSE